MRKLARVLFRSFLQGIVIMGPIGVTIYAIYFVFNKVDNLIPWVGSFAPGIGFVSVVLLITVIGYLGTRFFVARWLLGVFDSFLEHVPGVKYIYTSLKDVMDSFVGDKKKFSHPVWVQTSLQPEVWRIGFLTQQDMSMAGQHEKVAVYLPHSYAISGWVILVDKANTKPVVGMNAAEAMKFAVSGGVAGLHNASEQDEIR
jgi:uncharacterized membrane protein